MRLLLFVLLPLLALCAPKSKILIVFAHQEPQSFCFALRNRLFQTLLMKGHQVRLTNLVQQDITLPIDTTDFTELYDPTYFRPVVEQGVANMKRNRTTFSKELRVEHDKVEWADTILFVFPYYIMYMPGIMKSWIERVFSYGFAFGEGHSLKGRKAMLMYTTGAPHSYIEKMENAFWYLVYKVFAAAELTPLKPYAAYAVKDVSAETRKEYLNEVERIAADIENREPYTSEEKQRE